MQAPTYLASLPYLTLPYLSSLQLVTRALLMPPALRCFCVCVCVSAPAPAPAVLLLGFIQPITLILPNTLTQYIISP